MSASPRPAAPSSRRRSRLVAAVLLGLVVGGPAMGPAAADSTPAPTGPAGAPVASPFPCPTGQTSTLVTSPPPASPRSGGTPAATVTTRPDGSTVRPVCAIAPPTPFPGPVIAPEHVVGGPRLAGTGVIVHPTGSPASVPAPPDVTDVSWVISDLDTGEVLAAKDPHALLLPASTLKTLLTLVTLPVLKPATVVRASDAAVGAIGTRVGLVAGAPYTVDQLFHGLLLVSGNDTAYALAEAYGGTAKTLAAMNAKAAALGAWDTVAKDPSGLDEDGQHSSAYDLSLLGRAVMQLPQFRRYAVTTNFTFPGGTDPSGKVHAAFQISNHNTLLENYPGTVGVKNGYTSGARHTFIGAVRRGGRTLLITEMGGVVVPSWQPTAALLDWAFAHAGALTPVGTLVAPGAPRPPEWRDETTAATTTATATPSAVTPSTTTGTPFSSSSSSGPVAVAGSGAGGDPFPGVLASARTASASPGARVALVVLMAALAGWLLVRRRRRDARGAGPGRASP
ncbi:MAG: hypothetical protein ABI083_02765 [Lapillicoccus sp.]